jgi:hypothetical protein
MSPSFFTKAFTDEEVASLILTRVVPASFQGGFEDAAELLELVDGLWSLAEDCYRQALRRPPDPVERRWLMTGPSRRYEHERHHPAA